MHYCLYYGGKYLIWLLLLLLTRYRVRGRENVPHQGPLLIVSNHLNLADPPIVGIGIGRKMAFLAKEALFRPRLAGYVLRRCGAFPVRRGGINKEALCKATHLMAQGMALIMFPEGRRSPVRQLEPAFSGSAFIAMRSGAPILPASISGTEKLSGLSWLIRRPEITVNIGRPFSLPPVAGKLTRAELTGLTDSIMEHIAELLPAEYHGKYTRPETEKHES
ncbi:MAG: 1-acyl-sn-glycerol-3-phosphate acyltransferase [Dehalococcoidales bacterium]|jgi:1-acyl-sn-glycerol-3-phosphate acyltransferase|nr:1-acyl-sn-glycerol-3-phosphate acyltransferase [Dehalococcoidales bacterium]MDP6576289.1 lysophospholipid acyltransferase family protein [Dehalococcoidales bacterium]MDP6824624.1 lysophospholipid acyltransferase family protein [Dehalococcoidales bacterium]